MSDSVLREDHGAVALVTIHRPQARNAIDSRAARRCGEALRLGLVNRVLDADRLLPEALRIAGRIASNAPVAVRTSLAPAARRTSTKRRCGPRRKPPPAR